VRLKHEVARWRSDPREIKMRVHFRENRSSHRSWIAWSHWTGR